MATQETGYMTRPYGQTTSEGQGGPGVPYPIPAYMTQSRSQPGLPWFKILGLAALGLTVFAGIYYLGPDLRRYMKIRNM